MEYDHKLITFCERKLYPDRPEYLNAASALYISLISYYMLKCTPRLSNLATLLYLCIFTNGIASFLYHWYALYIFKLFDEFSMIIPVWLGISKIMLNFEYPTYYIGAFTMFNIALLVLDVFPQFDPYFPLCFLFEFLLILPLFYQSLLQSNNTNVYVYHGVKGIIICFGSIIVWVITEKNCNKYLIFGHTVWHIGLSTGLCYIISYFNSLTHCENTFQKYTFKKRYF